MLWLKHASVSLRCGQQVLNALEGLQVEVASTPDALIGRLSREDWQPSVLLLAVCSRDELARGVLDQARQLALDWPLVVLDETFDAQLRYELLASSVQDYLRTERLDAELLQSSLENAVLRFGHAPRPPVRATQAAERILALLSPSQREVLDLYRQGLSVKEIARLRRTRPVTVYRQLAGIRQELGVESNQELLLFGQGGNSIRGS